MLFSDPVFFGFFAIYFLCHLLVPPRWRVSVIIIGSTVFYGWWRVDFVWLPYLLSFIAYVGVLTIQSTDDQKRRRKFLAGTLIVLFGPLVFFKYCYFFAHDVIGAIPGVLSLIGDVRWLKMPLPLGISFITFTLTAYVVDVFEKRYPTEQRFPTVLAHVLFFPHLIAGPILRPNELMPQLRQIRRAFDARFTLGAALFAQGLIKKLVFADSISGVVDAVFQTGATPTGWEYLLAVYGFSMQIYCDFSGYTDMAIGLAYLIRIRLPTNFRQPYTSMSVVEFWRRWHLTLSHWLRDYLYIPLGGNRLGQAQQFANLLITMVLGGLWHGANWTFVIWGALHGGALVVSHLMRRPIRRMGWEVPGWVGILLTFNFVTLAWVFFRSPDIDTACRVLGGPFVAPWPNIDVFAQKYLFEILLLAFFLVTHQFDRHACIRYAASHCNRALVWIAIVFCFVIAVTVSQGSSAKFIYFDF